MVSEAYPRRRPGSPLSTPSLVSTPPGVDAGPEPVPGLVPGARHDVVETTVQPAPYVSTCKDTSGHDGEATGMAATAIINRSLTGPPCQTRPLTRSQSISSAS